jgi:TonB-linked SusC/RagA family outer membrane protein
MKLTIFLMLVFTLNLSATGFGQISFETNGKSLREIFNMLEKETNYRFFYNDDLKSIDNIVDINVQNQDINQILDKLLENSEFGYKVMNNNLVVVTLKEDLQQLVLKGTVTDKTGNPLPGVTVLVKGTNNGTITDAAGRYNLSKVPADATLQFSFMGMSLKEVKVENQSTVDAVLTEEAISLEEVVVVGYGKQTKKGVTGSVSQVKLDEVADLPVAQFTQKLQGKVAGVQITQGTGIPGQGMNVRIRGAASVNAGSAPLYVVDGFPITGSINDINPDEIESISVLKDASASSLYGSRAANGVVLITTKMGEQGKTKVQFNAYKGVQTVPQKGRPDMMNAQEFAQFQKEYREDMAIFRGTTADIPADYQNPSQWAGKGTDWYNILLRKANIENYSLSLTSNKDNLKTSAILGYFNQDGVIIETNFKRLSLRINSEYKVNDKVKIGINIAPNLTSSKDNGTDGVLWGGGVIENALLTTPLAAYKNDDGTLPLTATGPGLFPNPNWYRVAKEREYITKTFRTLANAYIDWEIIRNLHFKSSINGEYGNYKQNFFIPSTSGYIFDPPPRRTEASITTNSYYSWLSENTLNYINTFNLKHNIEVLAGYSTQQYQSPNEYMYGSGFPDDKVKTLNAASSNFNINEDFNEWTLLSYIGRINYNFNRKYYLSASIRRDGSSRFGSNNKWGNFPSLSAGWVLSDESFFPKQQWVSYIKLRASYGLTGNNNIGNYTYYAGVQNSNYVFNNVLSNGRSTNSLGNQNLGWEKTKGTDIGIDFGFLKDRITLAYDYYYKITSNMLYNVKVPQASGYSSIMTNIGEFKIWGHEFFVSSKNLVGKLKWNTDFNITFNRNKVMKLGTQNAPIGGEYDNPSITMVGQPIGMLHGFIFDGIYKNQAEFDAAPHYATSAVGTVRYKDISGPDGVPDGIIDNFDTGIIGNPNPKFILGMTNTFSYKKFDLSVIISGSYGNDIMNRALEYTQNLDAVFNLTKDVANRWRSPENPGDGLHPTTNTGTPLARYDNSRWVSDGSYLTLKNITFGYTIPFKNSTYFEKLRIYGSIQQAFVFTKYNGANPEVSSNGDNPLYLGIDFTTYPVPRTFTFGVNVNF